jgi:hypothetical protein
MINLGDELLEIDGIQLYSINYLTLLDILRSLKRKIMTIVVARKVKVPITKKIDSSTSLTQLELKRKRQRRRKRLAAKSQAGINNTNDSNMFRTKSEGSLLHAKSGREKSKTKHDKESTEQNSIQLSTCVGTKSTSAINENQKKRSTSTKAPKEKTLIPRSRSLELYGLSMWNKKLTYINLIKSEKGLGFSLIDYQQDPFNPLSKKTVVIRALVPNGVAQQDGRLMPGQRLVSINECLLDDDLIFLNEKIINNKNNNDSDCDNDKDKSSSQKHQQMNSACSTASMTKLCAAPPLPDILRFTVEYLKSLPVGKSVKLGVQLPLAYPDEPNPESDDGKNKIIASSSNYKKESHLKPNSKKKQHHHHHHHQTNHQQKKKRTKKHEINDENA